MLNILQIYKILRFCNIASISLNESKFDELLTLMNRISKTLNLLWQCRLYNIFVDIRNFYRTSIFLVLYPSHEILNDFQFLLVAATRFSDGLLPTLIVSSKSSITRLFMLSKKSFILQYIRSYTNIIIIFYLNNTFISTLHKSMV